MQMDLPSLRVLYLAFLLLNTICGIIYSNVNWYTMVGSSPPLLRACENHGPTPVWAYQARCPSHDVQVVAQERLDLLHVLERQLVLRHTACHFLPGL